MLKRDIEVQKVCIIAGRPDMRSGVTGLAAQVLLCSGQDSMEKGLLFLFCGRRKDRIKGIMYEDDGFILINKKLTNGRYCWPESQEQETRCLIRQADVQLPDSKHNKTTAAWQHYEKTGVSPVFFNAEIY